MTDGEARQARRLRRMQWLASGLLALMAAVFVLTSYWRDTWPLLGFVRAFSEAALIGGLADWFAVTALFRRPLGLPIPHTAIVPNRKDEIGRSLARFVADHFLVRKVLDTELQRLELARSFGRWLQQPANAASVARDVSVALSWMIRDHKGSPLRDSLRQTLGGLGRSLPVGELIGALIDVLASGQHAQQLIDSLVALGHDQLDRHRHLIRERIRERSPWWLPRFVDEEIFDQLIAELERILDEIGDDAGHPARAALVERLRQLRLAVESDPEFRARCEALRDELLNHPAVTALGRDIASRTQAFLDERLGDPGSDLRQGLERELARVGGRLADNDAVATRLDEWLAGIVIYLVDTYRVPISSIISSTIARWDSQATSRRIELQIGRDLQFIRINGTLVGGLVGLLLYLSWTAALV